MFRTPEEGMNLYREQSEEGSRDDVKPPGSP